MLGQTSHNAVRTAAGCEANRGPAMGPARCSPRHGTPCTGPRAWPGPQADRTRMALVGLSLRSGSPRAEKAVYPSRDGQYAG